MLMLPQSPNLKDFQKYVDMLEIERGFKNQQPVQKCLLLGEEMGELFKAVRKHESMPIDGNSQVGTIEEELADILIYVCAIANKFEIDLENAFRNKEALNMKRIWQ